MLIFEDDPSAEDAPVARPTSMIEPEANAEQRKLPVAGSYQTIAQIEAAYPNEWVLIDRPKVDRGRNVKGGYVVSHSTDRDEVE